jgi:hypothetical protein
VYDAEDQCFFNDSDHSRELVALRFVMSINAENDARFRTADGRRLHDFGVECMLYAVGWASFDASELRYFLVDLNAYSAQVAAVQAGFANWENDRHQALARLNYHGIPRTSSLSVGFPGTNVHVLVRVNSELIRDTSMCWRPFPRFRIVYQVSYSGA